MRSGKVAISFLPKTIPKGAGGDEAWQYDFPF